MSDSFLTKSNLLTAIQSLDNWVDDTKGLPLSNCYLKRITQYLALQRSILNRLKEVRKARRRRILPPATLKEQGYMSPLFIFKIPKEKERKTTSYPDFLEPSIRLLRKVSSTAIPFD